MPVTIVAFSNSRLHAQIETQPIFENAQAKFDRARQNNVEITCDPTFSETPAISHSETN
jgi:hypothetical protein